jgi:CRISPR-associated protein Csd1
MRLSSYHMKKLRSTKPGWARKLDESQIDIIDGIEITNYPATLSLEGQGLFFLGYYHQRAHRPEKVDQEMQAAEQAEESVEE